ncbi:hypothetical protein ACJQWK_07461 [Exserohilum turcicum]
METEAPCRSGEPVFNGQRDKPASPEDSLLRSPLGMRRPSGQRPSQQTCLCHWRAGSARADVVMPSWPAPGAQNGATAGTPTLLVEQPRQTGSFVQHEKPPQLSRAGLPVLS